MLNEMMADKFFLKNGTVPVFTWPGTLFSLGWHGVQPWNQFGQNMNGTGTNLKIAGNVITR